MIHRADMPVSFYTKFSGSAQRDFDGVAQKVEGLTTNEFYRAAAECFLRRTSAVVIADIVAQVEDTRVSERRTGQ